MSISFNRSWERIGDSPRLSVIMIGHKSAALLSKAILSLVRFSPPSSSWELVLVLNGDHEEVVHWAQELLGSERLPLALVQVSERRPGAARNAGVNISRAPTLLFLDDDIESFQDIVGAAIELFSDPALLAAGGANLTPPNSSAIARATGGLMASKIGAAGMSGRYRLREEGQADEHSLILCNLAVRKDVFVTERGFARHLISNEENVLLQRISQRVGKLLSSPRLAVFHYRRSSWKGLSLQAMKYGSGRAQNLLLLPETFRLVYFIPALFLCYVGLLPILLLWAGWESFLPLCCYAILFLVSSVRLAVRDSDPAQLLGIIVAPCVHLSYGLGFVRAGLFWLRKREQLKEYWI